MPLVTLTARTGKSSAFKSAIPDGVHRALIATTKALRGRSFAPPIESMSSDRVD